MKRITILLVGIALIFSYGCGLKQGKGNNDISKPKNAVIDLNEKISKSEQETTLILYFANNEYIQTGNEKLKRVLPEERTVVLGTMTKEEAVIRELMKGPKDSKLLDSIPKRLKLNKVEVKEGTVYIDFSKENLYGGSLEETLMIDSITESLGKLESVKKVQFLVDGKVSETLMGHIDATVPIEPKR